MNEVKVTGEGEVAGFVRDVREDVIMKAFGLVFSSEFRNKVDEVSVSREVIEEWIHDGIREVGEDHEALVDLVMKRLKSKLVE